MNRVWNHLYTLIVAGLLTGCALGGTEAGNPASNQVPTNEPSFGQLTQYLLKTICSKYTECYPDVSTTECDAGLLEQTNLPAAFGLPNGFGNVRDMVNAERTGSIRADFIRVVNCSNDVRNLSCLSNAISSAAPTGSPSSSSAYTGVINMIPTSGTSCAGVF